MNFFLLFVNDEPELLNCEEKKSELQFCAALTKKNEPIFQLDQFDLKQECVRIVKINVEGNNFTFFEYLVSDKRKLETFESDTIEVL